MALQNLKYNIAAGQTWGETLTLKRNFGTLEVIPANELSTVRLTLRRSPNRMAPVALDKTLARISDQYPIALSATETEGLKKGTLYADIRVEFSSGLVSYPVRFELNINATTTAA
jgi:hypothetical protein